MEQTGGKLKSLPLVEKLNLIEIIESGRSVKDVAEEFAINRNTLHYILKNKEKIRDAVNLTPGTAGHKRVKPTKSPELEMRVLAFMMESRSRNERISGSVIKAMALEIASELNLVNFAASNGWLFSFFKRNQISINEFNQATDAKRFIPENVNDEYIIEEVIENIEKIKENEDILVEAVNTEFECSEHENEPENEEFVEPEIIEEDEESQLDSVSDSEWRCWCRLCGSRETQIEVDQKVADIAQQLFNIPMNQFRICTECYGSLDNICRMKSKGKLLEYMFSELQELEKEQKLNEEDLVEIRRQFALEIDPQIEVFDIEYIDDVSMEEQDNAEDVVFEDNESETTYENLEVGPEEYIDFDTVEEQINVSEEVIETEHLKRAKKFADEDLFEYKCHSCGEIFERMFSLSNHTRIVHQTLPKVACTCGRYLSTWESLMTHKRKHSSNENSFSCDLCSSTFKTSSGLKIHIKFKHDKEPVAFVCSTCGREFKDGSTLKSHERTHLPDSEKFSHECDICGKRMVTQWSLKHHIKAIHEKTVNHFCHLCGRGFVDKSNLRSHLISHSTETVTCEICGGKFKNRVSLQGHKKLHKPKHSRNFSCEHCGKAFHNRNHLNRHMISHSDRRTFKCKIVNCTNEYKYEKDLTNHVAAVHTGERPHKCPYCDKKFVDNANLRKHKLKDHPEELAAFESQYGRGRRLKKVSTNQYECKFEEIVE